MNNTTDEVKPEGTPPIDANVTESPPTTTLPPPPLPPPPPPQHQDKKKPNEVSGAAAYQRPEVSVTSHQLHHRAHSRRGSAEALLTLDVP